jgi:hypothetical protein
MALQRNLKALGTFGCQTPASGNTVYITSRERCDTRGPISRSTPDFARLRELLSAHIEELRCGR